MNELKTTYYPQTIVASVPSIGNIDAYISWINQIPILTAEEETKLATKFHQEGDLNAARQLVISHLRFVAHIAKGYLGYGLPKADLIQEGTIGLMKAVKRFDPKFGVRLVSFAVHWIKAEIHEFILRNWRIVKIATTKAQRKLFFNLRRATKKLNWFSKEEIASVAKELAVDPKEVSTMEARMYRPDISFDAHDDSDEHDEGSSNFSPVNYLVSENSDPLEESLEIEQKNNRVEGLTKGLAKLDERSRDIITNRWLQENKATLHDLASKYGVSAERIRQLEENAFNKLKKELF